MKTFWPKLLIVMFLLVQLIAPAQAMLAAPLALQSDHKDHCQTHGMTPSDTNASPAIDPCVAHCLNSDKADSSGEQEQLSSCGGDASCGSSCNNCSHSNVILLNEFIFIHQAASHSPVQSSYDIYKYFPPLKLRPPRA